MAQRTIMERAYALHLVSNKPLLERVLDFNLKIPKDSAMQEESAEYAALRKMSPGLFLFESAAAFEFDFAQPKERLALLKPSELKQLCLYAGAARLAPFIRAVVDKEDLKKLYDVIAPKICRFALELASFAVPRRVQMQSCPKLDEDAVCAAGAELLLLLCKDLSEGAVRALVQEGLYKLFCKGGFEKQELPALKPPESERLWMLFLRLLENTICKNLNLFDGAGLGHKDKNGD